MKQPCASIDRRAFLALCLLAGSGSVMAEPINPGRFKPFVDANRLDIEIAHVLNVLDSYPAGTWSHDSSDFAFAQLSAGTLLGMTRAATARAKIEPQLLPRFAATRRALAGDIASFAGGRLVGFTRNFGPVGSMVSYVLIEDTTVTAGTQPGPRRERLAMAIVHELNHVRNREQLRTFLTASPPALFVDPALAGSRGGAATLFDFAGELAASHTAWRCVKEWDNRWRGTPLPRTVETRRLYQFSLEQAEHNRATSTYLQTLATRAPASASVVGDDFNRQVSVWMGTMRSMTFVNSAPGNVDVANLFDASAVEAAAKSFVRPHEPPDGGFNYWSTIR